MLLEGNDTPRDLGLLTLNLGLAGQYENRWSEVAPEAILADTSPIDSSPVPLTVASKCSIQGARMLESRRTKLRTLYRVDA
jgi:hypothetical protein